MKKLLMLVMVCYGLNAAAQEQPNENFIYLFSDSIIKARWISLRPDFGNSIQLRADSRRVPLNQVKFFNNQDGFYANTRKLDFGNQNDFAERYIDGKINLYEKVDFDPYLYDYDYRFRRRRQQPISSTSVYYNKGFGDLKRVNYDNLKSDMGDNRESLMLLEDYRKARKNAVIMYSAAGASILAGLVSFVVKAANHQKDVENRTPKWNGTDFGPQVKRPNFTVSFVLLGAGAGLAFGGYSFHVKSRRNLENVVENYNK